MSVYLSKIGKNKSKKAQLDIPILGFVVIVIGLIIFAPIMLKIFNSIKYPMSSAFTNVSVEAGAGFDKAISPLTNWWDKIIIFVFILSVLLLFISAFLIDTHPLFVVLYVLTCFFVVIFSNNIMKAADHIYDSSQFAEEANELSFMNFLRNNFFGVLLGIIIITGIIMYGKIAFFPREAGVRGGGGGGAR